MAKEKEKVNDYFYCMRMRINCPADMLGRPDCNSCEYYHSCNDCGRKMTDICERCDYRDGKVD